MTFYNEHTLYIHTHRPRTDLTHFSVWGFFLLSEQELMIEINKLTNLFFLVFFAPTSLLEHFLAIPQTVLFVNLTYFTAVADYITD